MKKASNQRPSSKRTEGLTTHRTDALSYVKYPAWDSNSIRTDFHPLGMTEAERKEVRRRIAEHGKAVDRLILKAIKEGRDAICL